MPPYLSNKIRTLQFAAIIVIVILHGNLAPWAEDGAARFIMSMMTAEVTRFAVPFFFACSGFLFFRNFTLTASSYTTKLKSRTRSLLLPFLLWNAIVLLIFTVAKYAGMQITAVPITYNPIDIFCTPIVYPMWFIRDLIIMVLCSPLVYLAVKYAWWLTLPATIIFWAMGRAVAIGTLYLSFETVNFFTIGCALAIYGKQILEKQLTNKPLLIITAIAWLILGFCNTRFHLPYWSHCIAITLGLYTFWSAYDCLADKTRDRIASSPLLPFSMWIFCFHEPLMTTIKKSFMTLLPDQILLIYFLAIPITLAVCLLVGYAVRRIAPKSYSVLTGGR